MPERLSAVQTDRQTVCSPTVLRFRGCAWTYQLLEGPRERTSLQKPQHDKNLKPNLNPLPPKCEKTKSCAEAVAGGDGEPTSGRRCPGRAGGVSLTLHSPLPANDQPPSACEPLTGTARELKSLPVPTGGTRGRVPTSHAEPRTEDLLMGGYGARTPAVSVEHTASASATLRSQPTG